MVEVRLYGKLRRFGPEPRGDRETIVYLEVEPGETVESVLTRLSIPQEEIAHIFLNGKLLTTRNSMAPWLRYQRARDNVPTCEPNLDHPLRDGDRLGIFGRDMALLVV
ncbi:MAG: hypothetical protein RMK30_06300 [Anaerolineae bacterium]|nr:hypothetical protein [Anaerolineae bacterium]MDW8102470.1 hypothetical protein [Anaerolineae bacterium]